MSANGFGLPSQTNMSSAQPNGLMSSAPSTINPKLRKRTKTGCLTCRKRRIKCGEERPTCNNCIKSKRHCEGYNQRVIWKPPIGDLSGVYPASSSIPYASAFIPGALPAYPRPVPPPILTQDPSLVQIHSRLGYDGFGEPQSAGHPNPAGPNGLSFAGPHSAPPYANQSPFSQTFTPISPPRAHPFAPHQLPQASNLVNGQHFPPPHLRSPPQIDPNAHPPQQYHPSPNFDPAWQQPQGGFPPTPVSIPPEFKPSLAESGLPTPAPTLTSQSSDSLPFLKPEDGKPSIWDGNGNGRHSQLESSPSGLLDQKPQLKREASGTYAVCEPLSNENHYDTSLTYAQGV
jgi:Fungal Zn(2)-Cys(6) binuclear cluster domain